MTDSHIVPFRKGVIGIAVAWSGIEGVESQVGKPDLYGKPLKWTEKAVADDLATAAILVSGETNEATPFVLFEDTPAVFTDREFKGADYFVAPRNDLYAGIRQVGAIYKKIGAYSSFPNGDDPVSVLKGQVSLFVTTSGASR